jgi:hypothetical protein
MRKPDPEAPSPQGATREPIVAPAGRDLLEAGLESGRYGSGNHRPIFLARERSGTWQSADPTAPGIQRLRGTVQFVPRS